MKRFLIATDAFPYLAVLGSLTWWLYFVNIPLAVLTFLLLAFIFFFFRNPPRKISMNDNVILSPADGKVMFIDEIDEPEFMGGKAKRVSIFLNVFNVHINRSPIEGTVEYIHYRPGQFIPAFKSHCSDINERNSVGIVGKNTKG
jgi:phosphatidylserine decarboxylase